MAGFIRRFTSLPTVEVLSEIEAVNVVDLAPRAPTTGVGSGTLMCIGEYEDGPFNDPQEVFGGDDMISRFGGFGYTYGGTPSNNPSARQHLFEKWNGNAFIKLKFAAARRLVCLRVDTSVGEIGFTPRASVQSKAGPFAIADALQFSATSAAGTGTSAAIDGNRAIVAGLGGTYPTLFAGGESFDCQVDGGPVVRVSFTAADQTQPQVLARINATLGYQAAVVNGLVNDMVGIVYGTAGSLKMTNVSGTPLATLFPAYTSGTAVAGIGNVGNLAAITASELATIVNASASMSSNNIAAVALSDGSLRLFATTGATLLVVSSTMALAMFDAANLGVTFNASVHPAGSIRAGTRVRTSGGAEWVTMQTVSVPQGTSSAPSAGPFIVKVRPATDDGTGLSASSGAVNILVDQPLFSYFSVSNASALSAALDENQLDVRYEQAFDASLDPSKAAASQVNFVVSARRSTATMRKGVDNAVQASANGMFGRKFIARAPLGFTQTQAIADVAAWRSDRLFYSWPGVQVRIPEIAFRGTAGGAGFTADGVVTVGADGPLATVNSMLPPEENPGQATGLIGNFFAVETQATPLNINSYKALKSAGIAGPRQDSTSGMVFQSGITSDLTPGKETMARRKMADFIQDSLAQRLVPYCKKLATNTRRDAIRAVIEQFLSELQAVGNPDAQRIDSFSVDETGGQTPDLTARGIFVYNIKVRTLSSIDALVLQTEIGAGVVAISEVA